MYDYLPYLVGGLMLLVLLILGIVLWTRPLYTPVTEGSTPPLTPIIPPAQPTIVLNNNPTLGIAVSSSSQQAILSTTPAQFTVRVTVAPYFTLHVGADQLYTIGSQAFIGSAPSTASTQFYTQNGLILLAGSNNTGLTVTSDTTGTFVTVDATTTTWQFK